MNEIARSTCADSHFRQPALLSLLACRVWSRLPAAGRGRRSRKSRRERASPPGWSKTTPCRSSRSASPSRAAATQDPPGKEGLPQLMTGLFDEGAGDSRQRRRSRPGSTTPARRCASAPARDTIYGSMRMLADNKDEAFELLGWRSRSRASTPAPIDRIRAQMVSGIVAGAARSRNRSPDQMGGGALWRPSLCAAATKAPRRRSPAITADDLHAFHKAIFAREKLHVAVVGAIDAETVKHELDRLFGALPEKPALRPVAACRLEARPADAGQLSACRRPRCSLPIRALPATRRISSPPF